MSDKTLTFPNASSVYTLSDGNMLPNKTFTIETLNKIVPIRRIKISSTRLIKDSLSKIRFLLPSHPSPHKYLNI